MKRTRTLTAIAVAVGAVGVGGVASATVSYFLGTNRGAAISCPGGMSRLGHVFDESASVFPGDPPPSVEVVANIPDNGFLVELVTTGTHTSTHLDAPGHFIDGGRTVDELDATEFVWPAYVVDVRDRMNGTEDDGFELTVADIRTYERANGRIPSDAMVIVQTGFDAFFGTDAFLGSTPGFSAAAVQWMVDNRNIGGVGSDTFGPDATSDATFGATFTILDNDRVALPGLNNVDSLNVKGDIIMAPAVALAGGSGYQVDPLACHGVGGGRNG